MAHRPRETTLPGDVLPALLTLVLAADPSGFRFEIARLEEPAGVAIAWDGSIYICESMGHRVSVFDGSGRAVRRWGRLGDRPGELDTPHGIAVGPDGNVYVADTGNHRIQVFDPEGRFLRQWGGFGAGPGQFREPVGLAVGAARVYVADSQNARVQVFDPTGRFLFYIWSHGRREGQLGRPVGVAVDPEGHLYVSDSDNGRIHKFDPSGRPLGTWADHGTYSGLLSGPGGIQYSGGRIYVADTGNHRIEAFDTTGIVVDEWVLRGGHPSDVAFSPSGETIAVCSWIENLCQLFTRADTGRRADPAVPPVLRSHLGTVAAASGDKVLLMARDAHSATLLDLSVTPPRPIAAFGGRGFELSEFVRPADADIDLGRGSILVSDPGSYRLQFFELASGPARDTWAGARFVRSIVFDPEAMGLSLADWHLDPPDVAPAAVTRDRDGNIFIADRLSVRLVVLDPELRLLRTWGGRGREDGRFLEPADLAWSASGEILYVVDSGRRRVQAFNRAGDLLYAWGRPGRGRGEFLYPTGIAAAADGSVYVVDRGARRVQRFSEKGRLLHAWRHIGSRRARLVKPQSVFMDGLGHVGVVDLGTDRVHLFTPGGKPVGSFGPEVLATGVQPVASEGPSPDGTILSNDGTYLVRYRTEPSPIPLNEPFSMEVLVYDAREPSRPAEAVSLGVEARMPAHRHGMNQVPEVRAVLDGTEDPAIHSWALEDPALGNGRYQVRGMLFHMPGVWELYFDLTRWAVTERAQVAVTLD